MLFTLYGDYILNRGGEVWVGTLIKLLSQFGLSEQAIRSALSRMSQKGWLEVRRLGNRSYCSLTDKGKKLLLEGGQLIYHGRKDHWDGRWHLLTYSIPEGKRDVRNRLRQELSWLGYGMLNNATWMSPRDVGEDVNALLGRLDICQYVECFTATHRGYADARKLVRRCWDLDSIGRQYAAFLEKYRPRYEEHLARLVAGETIADGECFVERFMLIHEYRKFPFIDPELPAELLPEGWPGGEAVGLFREYHRRLADKANSFFDSAFERAPR
ncbi:MAG: phenylacetic acid degradation operon negative regulatory protein PaaX [Chloroflexi bacterium]|nr:phenylacetic acid degradation operon negative regulatory protein PaaX [Chloroflexota bacterium]